MTYINTETVSVSKLTCSHPAVERIWEYGALSGLNSIPSTLMIRVIEIMLKDETRHKFEDDGKGAAIEEAEKFLQSLPLK